jgi:hypothetical protein
MQTAAGKCGGRRLMILLAGSMLPAEPPMATMFVHASSFKFHEP